MGKSCRPASFKRGLLFSFLSRGPKRGIKNIKNQDIKKGPTGSILVDQVKNIFKLLELVIGESLGWLHVSNGIRQKQEGGKQLALLPDPR